MSEEFYTIMKRSDFEELIYNAISGAIDKKLNFQNNDPLYTEKEARNYLKCSSVFLWQKRKQKKIHAVFVGKKLLYPKSSLDAFLGLTKGVTSVN